MSRAVDLIRPGIVAMFKVKGYTAVVREEINSFSIQVRLTGPNGYDETRSFEPPTINSDISTPLKAWRDELP